MAWVKIELIQNPIIATTAPKIWVQVRGLFAGTGNGGNGPTDTEWGGIEGDIADQTDLQSALTSAKARANHTGTQSADTVIDGTTNKAYTATEKTKLSGIATGATANDTNSNLRDRSTHAGTQAQSTIVGLETALSEKAPLNSPTFTGTVSGLTKSMVGLGNVDNTTDANKPVSTATQSALDLKADLVDGKIPANQLPSYVDDVLEYDELADFPATGESSKLYVTLDTNQIYRWTGSIYVNVGAGDGELVLGETSTTAYRGDRGKEAYDHISTTNNPHGVTKSQVGLGNVDNTSDTNKPVSTAQQTALDLKAPLASPTFTGTVSGITKAMVGLSNVDNTFDTAKPVSTAQQTALDLKAPLASPTFTGTVSGITKTMVGLGNVDNTSDSAKPVSSAQQTALDAKQDKLITIDDKTANYTLVLTDSGKLIRMNLAGANTFTVPPNADVAFSIGTQILVSQLGAGQITITPGSGVTLNNAGGLKSRAQYSVATLIKTGTNTWLVSGDLTV